MTSKVRIVKCPRCRKVLAEPSDVPLYKCGGCGAILQAKKRNNSTVDTTSQRPDEHSSEKLKLDRAFGDQEAGSSSNQQSVLNSTNEPDQNSDHNDLHSSNKDEDAAKKAVEEYSNETLKIKQLSDNQEPCCSSNQQPLVNSSDEHEPDQITHNEPRSSTEFSGHEDPESSPEVTPHNIIEQEQEQEQDPDQNQNENITVVQLEDPSSKQQYEQLSDNNETDTESLPERITHSNVNRHETEFVSCRNEIGVEESDSEFEEATGNTRIIRDSDGGSKSSFKNMIAEKLLDTRQKKPVNLDEDELLSEDGSADLRHRKRFGRVSSVESMETARLAGASYYGYEGSVSSFDGTEDQGPGKKHIGSIRDEHVDSGNWYRFNRRSEYRPLSGRLGKDEHRSLYSLNEFHENPRHRSQMIPENPKMERIELLKLVQELQDQLERTNVSNLNPQQVPLYYNHVLNNAGRYGQRMAFSGEATAVNRRRDAGSCHHCCPQGRHFSAQLPRQHVCCNRPSYGPDTYHSQHFSGPSSPKHNHSESEFSAPDDHWQPNEIMKPKKQYVRPIAGGSPWIACYRCFKLLQLPQSFLLFNKRYHSIRCGSCMKVLNFTLTNGTHVSRYYPEETIAAPPSSEAEDFDKLTMAGPVSCSDRSFEKSYSTETDRHGSHEFGEKRRKATMSRDPSGLTRPPSSRVSGRRTTTSEIDEAEPEHRPGPNGSPLHWLMGYASPSKVIRGL